MGDGLLSATSHPEHQPRSTMEDAYSVDNPPPPKVKDCPKCGAEKTPEKDASQRYGVSWKCKPCSATYLRSRNHSIEGKQKRRAWTEKNRDRIREVDKAHYQRNAENERKTKRRLREKDPEKHRASIRRSRAKYRERHNAISDAWRIRNPERVKKNRRAYAKTPKGKEFLRRGARIRRARHKQVERSLSLSEEREIMSASQCAYCSYEFTEAVKKTMDHIIPLKHRGPHIKENLIACCKSCNSAKNDTLPWEWGRLKNIQWLIGFPDLRLKKKAGPPP